MPRVESRLPGTQAHEILGGRSEGLSNFQGLRARAEPQIRRSQSLSDSQQGSLGLAEDYRRI